MELIIYNGKIWQGANSFQQALLVKKDRIVAVGSNDEILTQREKETRIIDAQGCLILPGFNDAHVHLMEGGFQLLGVDLRDAANENEFCRRLQQKAEHLPKGTWITGGFWDHERWPGKKLPRKELIDQVVPDHPVFVVRLDWHIGCANSLALVCAGIDRFTQAPSGGIIDLDPATGEPTGILRESAHRLIAKAQPKTDRKQKHLALKTALNHAARLGVTSIQGSCEEADLTLYEELAEKDELSLRISTWHNVTDRSDIPMLQEIKKISHPFLRTGTVKLFCDGSFGASTALLSQPYHGAARNYGLAVHPLDELVEIGRAVHQAGWQMAIHAIGDRGVSWTLDAIAAAQKFHSKNNLRHRIEHAQMVVDADLLRFKQLEVIASVQPSHAIDDMRWIENRLGDRTFMTYRLNSFLHAGISVAIGTDWTVEPLDPMLTLYAAVGREYPEGGPEGGWQPQEKVTLDQALTGYTIGSAFAENSSHEKGKLQPGYLADFIILSNDLFAKPPRQWLKTEVDLTVVGGQVVWER